MKREGHTVMDDPRNSQGMGDLKWITDRLPRLEDADSDKNVLVLRKVSYYDTHTARQHFILVRPGEKWRPGAKAEARADVFPVINRRLEPVERCMTTPDLISRLNAVTSELTRRVREGLI